MPTVHWQERGELTVHWQEREITNARYWRGLQCPFTANPTPPAMADLRWSPPRGKLGHSFSSAEYWTIYAAND